MTPIGITITGPGGCLETPFHRLYSALIEAGAKVTIVKPPHPGGGSIGTLAGFHITLVCDDQPWGG